MAVWLSVRTTNGRYVIKRVNETDAQDRSTRQADLELIKQERATGILNGANI